VVIYTRRDDSELPRRVQVQQGVTVQHVDAGPPEEIPKDEIFCHMDAFACELERSWRRLRPDIVHAHFWMSGHASLTAASALGIPVVQTFHALGVVKRRYQGDKDTSPPERIDIEREIVRSVDHVIATCTDEVFELLRMGVNGDRLTVVPCGVDLSLFTPDGPRDRRTPGMRRLVTVGRLVERKGIGNTISALPDLPDAELVVAGGPERSRLRRDSEARRLLALAEQAGVADRVELRGRLGREAVPPLIRSADAVVAVPWYEPFGIVPVEAMACGVPVIAAAIGGMVDTVVDEVTGIHVPPRDPERLAQAAAPLLADRERRARLGRAGVERARRLYDWHRIAAATLDVYARLARSRARSSRFTGEFELPPSGRDHLAELTGSLTALERETEHINELGERVARRLFEGRRLLAVGNGGSAAQAQHLTAELVGRYHTERQPLSAICLHADTSSLTAIGNDYGLEEIYARQVRAHGRPGDLLIALSTSGRSANVVAAAEAASEAGLHTCALTGAGPNPLAGACDEAICLPAPSTATVQEMHLIALHMVCAAVDRELALRTGAARGAGVLA
jgi:phosphoheptose isomerase/glycosyltransferase involved in cell wall biosynthesis